MRRCHYCGEYKPCYEPGVWYSSRECAECGAEKIKKSKVFLKELEENVKNGNTEKINFRQIMYNTTSYVSAAAEAILKQNPKMWEKYKSQSPLSW
jgi:hypothetical protein